MYCESGGRPNAIGGGSNYGLFQLNAIHARTMTGFWENWMVPEWNVAHAYGLYTARGWRPWACA
jgi:hypothetical protein